MFIRVLEFITIDPLILGIFHIIISDLLLSSVECDDRELQPSDDVISASWYSGRICHLLAAISNFIYFLVKIPSNNILYKTEWTERSLDM